MKVYYKNSTGITISLVLKKDGVPIVLTSMTVTLELYSVGTNTRKWTHAATIDDATNGLAHYTTTTTDFDTLGDYYSNVILTKTGYQETIIDEMYKIVENQESAVTPATLLAFLNLPVENAMPTSTIQMYLDQATTSVNMITTSLANTTNPQFLELKRHLIMIKAATLYFMNMGESNINPEIRIQKIKLWTEEAKGWEDRLNNSLSSASETGSGVVRRVKSTTYDDDALPYDITGT